VLQSTTAVLFHFCSLFNEAVKTDKIISNGRAKNEL
jgi:hypothetical protein